VIPDDSSIGYNFVFTASVHCVHCASTARVHLTAAFEQKVQRTVSHVDKTRTFSLLSNCSEKCCIRRLWSCVWNNIEIGYRPVDFSSC
jgi:hypothetical protein